MHAPALHLPAGHNRTILRFCAAQQVQQTAGLTGCAAGLVCSALRQHRSGSGAAPAARLLLGARSAAFCQTEAEPDHSVAPAQVHSHVLGAASAARKQSAHSRVLAADAGELRSDG